MLTADRLLEPEEAQATPPEGGWNDFVYAVTLHR